MKNKLELKTDALNQLAYLIELALTELYGQKMGFALFMFTFGDDPEAGDYVSNGKKPDMIKFMHEIADRLEKNEDIGTPIGTA